jgi:hypothetical protein
VPAWLPSTDRPGLLTHLDFAEALAPRLPREFPTYPRSSPLTPEALRSPQKLRTHPHKLRTHPHKLPTHPRSVKAFVIIGNKSNR